MIRRMLLSSAAVVALVLAAPLTLEAQNFYISAGAAFPSGDAGDVLDTGWMAAGGVIFDLGTDGLWAGVEGTYGNHGTIISDVSANTWSAMGFLGYSFPTDGSADPYIFGGAGVQNGELVADLGGGASASQSESEFGWMAGLGVAFGNEAGSVRPYLEGRYQSAGGDLDYQAFGVLVGITISSGN